MAINKRRNNRVGNARRQVERMLESPKSRTKFFAIVVQAAQRQVRKIGDHLQSESGFKTLRSILKKETVFKEKRMRDIGWDLDSTPPKDKTIIGRYDDQTHTVCIYKPRIKSLPILLEVALHELLHSGEERSSLVKGVGSDDFRNFFRLPEFLSVMIAALTRHFSVDEKNDVRDSVEFFLKIHSKRESFSPSPEMIDRFMEDKDRLASVFMLGVTVWHELQIDIMACETINYIIKSGGEKGIVGKKNLTRPYPDQLLQSMQMPLDPAPELSRFNGLRGYLNSHQTMAWWLSGIFSRKDQFVKYEKFQQMARGYMFFGREDGIVSVGSCKVKNTLEKKLRDCLVAVDPYNLAMILLSLSARKFAR